MAEVKWSRAHELTCLGNPTLIGSQHLVISQQCLQSRAVATWDLSELLFSLGARGAHENRDNVITTNPDNISGWDQVLRIICVK